MAKRLPKFAEKLILVVQHTTLVKQFTSKGRPSRPLLALCACVTKRVPTGKSLFFCPPRIEVKYLQRNGIENTVDLMGHLLDRLDVTILPIEQIDVTQDMPDAFMWKLGQHLREPLELLQDLHDCMREAMQD